MIFAPACASASAVARPMPALAPVMSTALPDSGVLIRLPFYFMDHQHTGAFDISAARDQREADQVSMFSVP
jgi:hypothetical protein